MKFSLAVLATMASAAMAAPFVERGDSQCGPNTCIINGVSVLDCSTVNIASLVVGDTFQPCSGCDNGQTCVVNGLGVLDCSNINIASILNELGLGGSGGGLLGGLLKRDEIEERGNTCYINGISVGDCTDINVLSLLFGNNVPSNCCPPHSKPTTSTKPAHTSSTSTKKWGHTSTSTKSWGHSTTTPKPSKTTSACATETVTVTHWQCNK
ncbi:hypothetical protein BD324DRAFT_624098 [Kockovaella imperatae]|uniref:Hydrophobin n=1 Tax=Kockovaella imperatae TaxID=4999 RepID=A0A1Y1ULK1_9TREE|nr:hypothetical protein BD324DRAFT_624098 [Kockovaella imperatae]ORX37995.1 hypothetical protein BD324DRAFT_624098 [Kockovaella imperatae]